MTPFPATGYLILLEGYRLPLSPFNIFREQSRKYMNLLNVSYFPVFPGVADAAHLALHDATNSPVFLPAGLSNFVLRI